MELDFRPFKTAFYAQLKIFTDDSCDVHICAWQPRFKFHIIPRMTNTRTHAQDILKWRLLNSPVQEHSSSTLTFTTLITISRCVSSSSSFKDSVADSFQNKSNSRQTREMEECVGEYFLILQSKDATSSKDYIMQKKNLTNHQDVPRWSVWLMRIMGDRIKDELKDSIWIHASGVVIDL